MKLWERLGVVAFWLSWPLWRIYLRFGIRTKVLVVCGNQVLVVKNWLFGGRWALPGGGVKRGEEPAQAALRELQEETSLVLSQPPELLFKDIYHQYGIRFRYWCYAVELSDTPVIAASRPELAAAKWIDKAEITAENAGPDVRKAIQQWYQG